MRALGWSLVAGLMLTASISVAQQSESVGSLPPIDEPERAETATPVPEQSQLPAQPPPPPAWRADSEPAWPRPYDARATDEPEPGERRWYGWQTLIADGASFGLLLLAASAAGSSDRRGNDSGSELLLVLSGLSYVFTPPVIHAAHGRAGTSFASAGLRVGLPIAGVMIGTASADCGNDSGSLCGLDSAVIGFSVGVLSAIAIDAAFLAWDSEPESARRAPRVRLSPAVAPLTDGVSAGVVGSF